MRSRFVPLAVALVAAVLGAACGKGTPPARQSAAIVGGELDHDHVSVVGLEIGPYLCTGIVVAPRVVATAAHCVQEAVDAGEDDEIIVHFGEDLGQPTVQIQALEAVYHKQFRTDTVGVFDVAMIHLAEDAPVPPMLLNELDMSDLPDDQWVDSVGYGDDGSGFAGVRLHGILPLGSVERRRITVGRTGLTICNGDSGGPDFYDFGDGIQRVVGIHSYGLQGCVGAATSMRVDAYMTTFFNPVLDAWDGPCKLDGVCVTEGCRVVDGDCDPCGFEGTCAYACELPDLDCPVGGQLGEMCSSEYDCDSRLCIPGIDDARVTYCSDVCDPGYPGEACGSSMLCQEYGYGQEICVFPAPTPGAQGSPCSNDDDCHGLCDLGEHMCVEECDIGSNACQPPFTCNLTDFWSVPVCHLQEDAATRPFSSLCGASAAEARAGARGGSRRSCSRCWR